MIEFSATLKSLKVDSDGESKVQLVVPSTHMTQVLPLLGMLGQVFTVRVGNAHEES